MRHAIAITTLFIILLAACNKSTYRGQLETIDSLIARGDMAALTILDSLSKNQRNFTKKDYMLYHFLLADAHNQFFIPMKADTFMTDVADYYNRYGNDKQRIKALYLLGCVYCDKGDAPMAIEYYNKAVEQADTTQADCDFKQLSRVYAQMAGLFDEQRTPKMELKMWGKAIACAEKVKDTLAVINFLDHMGGAYYLLNDKKKALEINHDVYKRYIACGRASDAAGSLLTTIEAEIENNQLKEAKKHIDEYIKYTGVLNGQQELTEERISSFFYIGKYYEAIEKNDSAEYFYRKLWNGFDEIEYQEAAYKGLLSVFEKSGEKDSIAKYARLFADANDSANFQESATEITRAQALYNYNESKRKATEKEEENNNLIRVIYGILFLVSAISVIGYLHRKKMSDKRKAQQMAANKEYSSLLFRFSKATSDVQALRHDMERFKKQKEQEIMHLQEQLSFYQEDTAKEKEWDIEQALLSHQIVIRFHDLAVHANMPTEKEWRHLIEIISQRLSDFYTKISNASYALTSQEIKTSILVRLYFSPSEIATLLNLKNQRITNIRSAINKKLFSINGAKGIDKNIREM